MMRTLCIFDTAQVISAVHHYLAGINDDELVSLLRPGLKDLDSYHREALESLLAASESNSAKPFAALKNVFETFIAENPRVLEQLSPVVTESILRHAATEEPSMDLELRASPLQRYAMALCGLSGALLTAAAFSLYLHFSHFGASPIEPTIGVAPPVPITIVAKQRQPARITARASNERKRKFEVLRVAKPPAARVQIASQRTAIATVKIAFVSTARPLAHPHVSRESREPRADLIPAKREPAVAMAPAVAIAPKVPIAPLISTRRSVTDTSSYSYVVQQSDDEVAAAPKDAPANTAPARYCYSRGTWRTC